MLHQLSEFITHSANICSVSTKHQLLFQVLEVSTLKAFQPRWGERLREVIRTHGIKVLLEAPCVLEEGPWAAWTIWETLEVGFGRGTGVHGGDKQFRKNTSLCMSLGVRKDHEVLRWTSQLGSSQKVP